MKTIRRIKIRFPTGGSSEPIIIHFRRYDHKTGTASEKAYIADREKRVAFCDWLLGKSLNVETHWYGEKRAIWLHALIDNSYVKFKTKEE